MARLGFMLSDCGVKAILPDDGDKAVCGMSQDEYLRFKRSVSLSHFKKIQNKSTFGILVANFEKRGIKGYIGANTFAEIAVAFASGKAIYLLAPPPEAYADEITAWGAIVLGSGLGRIGWDFERSCQGARGCDRVETQLRLPTY
jgi:hypothetical protein